MAFPLYYLSSDPSAHSRLRETLLDLSPPSSGESGLGEAGRRGAEGAGAVRSGTRAGGPAPAKTSTARRAGRTWGTGRSLGALPREVARATVPAGGDGTAPTARSR